MIFMPKTRESFGLTILTSLLLLSAFSFTTSGVQAQTNATVNILDSIGGTIDPAAGTYTYNDGTPVTVTANPGVGTNVPYSYFWVITSNGETRVVTDNPLSFSVSAE